MLKPNEHNFNRIRRAVEHDYEWELVEKPKIAIADEMSNTDKKHVVNCKSLLCSCMDFKHNCNEGEYCKHIWYLVLKRSNMI